MIPPRIELGTLSVLDSRDNHYTTEPTMPKQSQLSYLSQQICTPEQYLVALISA